MPSRPRVMTRGAVFYGDRFRDACSIFKVSGAVLDEKRIISTGTTTKLNRRYRGWPVELPTRDRIVEFLTTQRTPEIDARLDQKKIVLDSILLPATFRLSDRACNVYAEMNRPYRLNGVFKADHVYEHSVRLMLHGGFGVEKHVRNVAAHIMQQIEQSGAAKYQDINLNDLFEEVDDHNACFPSIYRLESRQREAQLTLLQGGRP